MQVVNGMQLFVEMGTVVESRIFPSDLFCGRGVIDRLEGVVCLPPQSCHGAEPNPTLPRKQLHALTIPIYTREIVGLL